jgi:hypothetical protein
MGKETISGSEMNILSFASYFQELRNNFWVKILKFFDADPDPGSRNLFDPGSGMEKIRIRDKHPWFATLLTLMQFAKHTLDT